MPGLSRHHAKKIHAVRFALYPGVPCLPRVETSTPARGVTEIGGRGVTYRDGDFSSRTHHEFYWIDTVGGSGNWFLMTVLMRTFCYPDVRNGEYEKLFTIPSCGLHVGGVYMKPMKGGEQLL